MKKYIISLIGLLFIFNVQASDWQEGKQFITLPKATQHAPAVLAFFSFYCPSCYRYDEVMKVAESVQQALPQDIELTQYHASFMGPLGQELTHAWSVAILLGVEKKVKPLIFEAIQQKNSLKNLEDIRAIFARTGVTNREFDASWDSFAVKALTAKQTTMAEDLDLRGVPAMFVNGKYQINVQGLNTNNVSAFVKSYADTVNYLLSRD